MKVKWRFWLAYSLAVAVGESFGRIYKNDVLYTNVLLIDICTGIRRIIYDRYTFASIDGRVSMHACTISI